MNKFTKVLLVAVMVLVAHGVSAQRVKQTINDGWQFSKFSGDASAVNYDISQWENVSIPHSWNALDANDEVPGYYRGKGWYRKVVNVETLIDNQRVYLFFEGANQETTVYVNGKKVGNHKGGYTAFNFDVTDAVKEGNNIVAICVDNTENPDITPLAADFTFFGGIYRDLYLIYTPETSISLSHYSSNGVYLTTPQISDANAVVKAKTYLNNASAKTQTIFVETEIVDANGVSVAKENEKVKVKAQTQNNIVEMDIDLANPTRWDIDNPYLYTVYSRVCDKDGKLLDVVVNSLGVRDFSFDANEGFTLNGRYRKLVGTNRHQDYLNKGNALRDEMHVRDMKLIKDMGSNFLRISHYPQDPTVMQRCDQLGLVTSVEIPIINYITESQAYKDNCVEQVIEMIYQNFNSPSVMIWAYMNEVLLRPPFTKDQKEERAKYMAFVYEIASEIEATIRATDPSRVTLLPCHSGYTAYQEAGIAKLPMLLGFNLYRGWYSGPLSAFGESLDKLHKIFPEQVLLVTEYGADVDPRLHSFSPERFDFSCEYGNKYHEHYIKDILERKFVAGANIWNLNDFFSEVRRDAVPHINNKGIVGTDRERKDTYRLYQTYLKSTPEVFICSKEWVSRAGASQDGKTCVQPFAVYTNAAEVEVTLNGKSLGTFAVKDNKAELQMPFVDGRNVIEAVINKDGQQARDQYVCEFKIIDVKNNFTEMSVMLGSNRYFEDRTAELCWIPEQEYTEGSWGYVGGEKAVTETRHGALPASETEILGTDQDPVFQTQRLGIEAFKADVPDGGYAVYLYFAELTTDKQREALAYNLGNDAIVKEYQNRTFSIDINGTRVVNKMNIAEEYGSERAVIKKFVVSAVGGQGLTIDFGAIDSETMLNAIRIVREY